MKKWTSFLGGISGGILVLLVYLLLEPNPQQLSLNQPINAVPVRKVLFDSDIASTDLTMAAEQSIHAVVHVKTKIQQAVNPFGWNPFFEFFYGGGAMQPSYHTQVSAGSGVLVRPDGYIVTNFHVIQGAQSIEVTLNNKKSYVAEVVGSDASMDLALLKIEDKDLPYVSLANSDLARVGEWALAVGNPFNLTSTVTAGIISAKGRDIDILQNDYNNGLPALEAFIQTDAAVNPGNSGGALVNIKGELIGINTAIKSNTGSYAGYAFAIPSNIVRKAVEDFIAYGAIQRGFLGVSWLDMSPDLAQKLKLPQAKGVYIQSVTQASAADKAGIQEGDVLTRVQGKEIDNLTQLQELIAQHRPGDHMSVEYLRAGRTYQAEVVLQNKMGSEKMDKMEAKNFLPDYGAYVQTLSAEELDMYQLPGGVRVSSLRPGIFQKIGIQEGFMIYRVNQKNVKGVEELFEVLKNVRGGVLLEGFYPDGTYKAYAFGK